MILGSRYRIKQELGQGGFGRTYLVEDLYRFNERCVLKEFAPQVRGTSVLQKAKELFEREAGVLYKLQHPQIPKFRELFQTKFADQSRLFLVQDYVEGLTYRQLLDIRRLQGYYFSEPEVTQLLSQLLPVLQYLHSVGVIHRDISPENVILRSSDKLPVLIDFGAVKQVAAVAMSEYGQLNSSSSPTATRLGKMGYAPDEQMQLGDVSPHSDLYALAVTVLVLLTGKEPQKIVRDAPRGWQRQARLRPKLAAILKRMLAPRPSDRFQSATEVLQALNGGFPKPNPAPPRSPISYPSPQLASSLQQTQSVAPSVMTKVVTTTAMTTASYANGISSGVIGLFTLVLLFGLIGAGWWTRDRWFPLILSILPEIPLADSKPATNSHASTDSLPQKDSSEEELARKAALSDRLGALDVDIRFLTQMTNTTFYTRYPEQAGRTLTTTSDDAEWRSRWDAIANEWLNIFETNLSAKARSKLGSYTAADQEAWKRAVNQLYVGNRALNDLTDAKFFNLFPELAGQDFFNQFFGQIWQAIALDTVQSMQTGKILEQIQFEPGSFSHQVSGSLNPGAGKVYLASLSAGQMMRVNLQAPPRETLLSIYLPHPTPQTPFILEDSSEFTWSGRLPQSGIYEFVVVATGSESITYRFTIAVDNLGIGKRE
jgi:serine/threonine-protein kinase